jgi:hypothetical protein
MPEYTVEAPTKPIRVVGEPLDMLVEEFYRENVGYLVAQVWDEDRNDWMSRPEGTVFFIQLSTPGLFGFIYYAVTCRHVIEGIRDGGSGYRKTVFIRVNDLKGEAQDVPFMVDDWILGKETDVAVIRIHFGPSLVWWAYPMYNGGAEKLKPGHDVFFVGLFAPLPGDGSVQAIVRSGKVARPSTKVSVTLNPYSGESVIVDAYVVEANSWGGESGSPVFVYEQKYVPAEPPLQTIADNPEIWAREERNREKIVGRVEPKLLGLLHGHFLIKRTVMRGQTEIGGVDVNSGIAVVIPAEGIRATLMDERLVEDRARTVRDWAEKATLLPKPDSTV